MAPASSLPAWSELQAHRDTVGKSFVLKEAFAADPTRFEKYSRTFTLPAAISSGAESTEILFDFSKNFLADETLDKLVKLAEEAGVAKKRDDMFAGEKINFTEDRAVYHAALRNVGGWDMKVEGVDVMNTEGGVTEVLNHMKEFSEQVRSGEWKGFTGKKLTNIVNVGIGGSDLCVSHPVLSG
jgi:glucose-6-phosphate isomerase